MNHRHRCTQCYYFYSCPDAKNCPEPKFCSEKCIDAFNAEKRLLLAAPKLSATESFREAVAGRIWRW
jgi:hypothetical protein